MLAIVATVVNIALLANTVSSVETPRQCDVAPAHWCDTAETAARCGVTQQCEARRAPDAAPPVHLALYYETLSTGCRTFIADQLYPTWAALRNSGIFNLTLVPYGNANETFNVVTFFWNFHCEHGEEECDGNMIQACAMYYSHYNETKYVPFIHCMEALPGDPMQQAPKCAQQFGIDYKQLNSCLYYAPFGGEGNNLMHANALQTDGLNPKHTYVPWVTLNGAHTEQIQAEAMRNLLALVCNTYTGDPPQPCQQLADHQLAMIEEHSCKH